MIKLKSLLEGNESPEFQMWFRNSKIVDRNGNPMIVNHVSSVNDIDKFRPSVDGEMGAGIYITPNEDYVDMMKSIRPESKTYKLYAAIQNPYIFRGALRIELNLSKTSEIKKRLEKLGYDGAIQLDNDGKEMRQILALYPHQLKIIKT